MKTVRRVGLGWGCVAGLACGSPAPGGGETDDGASSEVTSRGDDTTSAPTTDPSGADGSSGGVSSGVAATSDTGGDPGTDDSTGAVAQCDAHPSMPGTTTLSIPVDGVARDVIVFVPDSIDPRTPAPVVLVFHGFTMSGQMMMDLTDWAAVAEQEGTIVAFADGASGLGVFTAPWNVGNDVCGAGAFASAPAGQDDFGYVVDILAEVSAMHCVDPDRVYASGFSMGGYFAHHLACNGPTGDDGLPLVRAIAAHSGGTYDAPCDHVPVPVMVLHGDADTLIDVSCGQQARDSWVARNGCGAEVDVQPVAGGECAYQLDCPAGGDVAMCTFFGMNHGWAGAEYTGPWITFQYGGGTEYEEAAALSWAFFAASG